jgi:hypothetical protein
MLGRAGGVLSFGIWLCDADASGARLEELVAADACLTGLPHTGPHTKPSLTANGAPTLLAGSAARSELSTEAIRALIGR